MLDCYRTIRFVLSLVNELRILKQGALFEKMTMSIEIERLVVGDEFQRINEEDDWRVFLTYTCEAEKGVSWSITGENRNLEFIRRGCWRLVDVGSR